MTYTDTKQTQKCLNTLKNLEFDTLIWEFGSGDNPDWVHISYVDLEKNRKRILKAVRDQGKVKYIKSHNV